MKTTLSFLAIVAISSIKKNRERVLSALIKNKYPDISKSLKKNKEQTGANR